MEEFASDAPLPVDYSQHSIGVTPLGTGELHLSSLMMSGSDDVLDTHVAVQADGESLGSFPLDCTLGMVPFDEYGTTTVHLPTGDRPEMLTVTGNNSGTEMQVAVPQVPAIPRSVDRSASDPSSCEAPLAASTLDVVVKPQRVVVDRTRARVITTVTTPDGAATGRIEVKVGSKTYKAKLENGRAVVQLDRFGKTGKKKVKVSYLGNGSTRVRVGDGHDQRPSPLTAPRGARPYGRAPRQFHTSKARRNCRVLTFPPPSCRSRPRRPCRRPLHPRGRRAGARRCHEQHHAALFTGLVQRRADHGQRQLVGRPRCAGLSRH